jgi:hypothetical protein
VNGTMTLSGPHMSARRFGSVRPNMEAAFMTESYVNAGLTLA